jgi:hypothetical protein
MKASNPKHLPNGLIYLDIEHSDFGVIPFAASPFDVEPMGRELYARAMAGEFGSIAPIDSSLVTEQHNAAILAQIVTIETAQVRPTRELLIDPLNAFAKAKLAALDAQIVALRAQLIP